MPINHKIVIMLRKHLASTGGGGGSNGDEYYSVILPIWLRGLYNDARGLVMTTVAHTHTLLRPCAQIPAKYSRVGGCVGVGNNDASITDVRSAKPSLRIPVARVDHGQCRWAKLGPVATGRRVVSCSADSCEGSEGQFLIGGEGQLDIISHTKEIWREGFDMTMYVRGQADWSGRRPNAHNMIIMARTMA